MFPEVEVQGVHTKPSSSESANVSHVGDNASATPVRRSKRVRREPQRDGAQIYWLLGYDK